MIEKKQKLVNLHTNPDFCIEVIEYCTKQSALYKRWKTTNQPTGRKIQQS